MLGPGGTMSGMYFDDARGLRKKNRKWKLLQPYLPYLGWGLLLLVTTVLAYREHRLSSVGQSLQTAVQELKVLQTQQTHMQVCGGRAACCPVSDTHHVCLCKTCTVVACSSKRELYQ
ncbi:hypothetical protein ABBQ38_007674 [Trebouxia sp. C0009 RCD-2024]